MTNGYWYNFIEVFICNNFLKMYFMVFILGYNLYGIQTVELKTFWFIKIIEN